MINHAPKASNNHKTMVRNAPGLTRFESANPLTNPTATAGNESNVYCSTSAV